MSEETLYSAEAPPHYWGEDFPHKNSESVYANVNLKP
jgi:hypothetical protein